ncbi:MAG TPA: HTTM domain-containing protein, partial [Candidatus Kryptonia bacterium]|nr:HTTM domain-containing protein [Candidatus Kryptonia bacterium]
MIKRRYRLAAFFDSTAEPLNLAIFRIVVFACLLRAITRTDAAHLVQLPAGLRVPPPGYAPFFDWIPFQLGYVTGARILGLTAAGAALVGFTTRMSAAVACVCATYLLGLPGFFGKVNHTDHHLIWFAALLAAAPSGDALSIDALRAAWRRADRGDTAPPSPSLAYALPLRLVWLLIGVIYFFPGFWKLRAGTEWFASDNIKLLMYQHWLRKGFIPLFRLDRYPLLYRSAGLGTVVFESSFVVCLFCPGLRTLALLAGVVFHWMTKVYLHIFFAALLACYAAFVDWNWAFASLGAMLFSQDLVLTYDPRDHRQRRLTASLRAFDVLRRVRYVASSEAQLGVASPAAESVRVAVGT